MTIIDALIAPGTRDTIMSATDDSSEMKLREKLGSFFDRVVVVNLRRRPDRLQEFWKNISEIEWPFKAPEVFQAVDGSKVPVPHGWGAGGGAWGCMQSHRQVLERAILDDIDTLLVLEDDVCFRPRFRDEIANFLTTVPKDWDGLMLGGQHINMWAHPPKPVVEGIVRCMNTQRTHAYAVRGKYLRDLYQKWSSSSGHCDHIMGPFAAKYRVYAPDPFVAGQSRGRSDISGSHNPAKFWTPPPAESPVVLLKTSRSVAEELRERGFHGGYTRDSGTGVDVGLRDLAKSNDAPPDKVRRLKEWIDMIQWEVASMNGAVCSIWCPQLEEDLARNAAGDRLIILQGEDANEIAREFERVRKQGMSSKYEQPLSEP